MSDDFDEDDFDAEDSETQIPAVSQPRAIAKSMDDIGKLYNPTRLSYIRFCSLSAPKQFSQAPYDYSKQLQNLMIREQTTTIQSQKVETAVQTYLESQKGDASVQTPEISQNISSVDILLKINNFAHSIQKNQSLDVIAYLQQNLSQFAKSNAKYDMMLLKQLKIAPEMSVYLVQFTLNGEQASNFSLEFKELGSETSAQLLNNFEYTQNLLFYNVQNQFKLINYIKPVDFCILNSQLYVLNQGGCVSVLQQPEFLILDNSEQIEGLEQMAAAGTKIVGVCKNQIVVQFSDVNSREIVKSNAKRVFSCQDFFIAQFAEGAQYFENINELKSEKIHRILQNCQITSVEVLGHQSLKVSFDNQLQEIWQGYGDNIKIVQQIIE